MADERAPTMDTTIHRTFTHIDRRSTPPSRMASSAPVSILNPDGSQRVQKTLINGYLQTTAVQQNSPIYQIITPGGDTQGIFNFEYRIPIFGPVTMAPFVDAGLNRILRNSQLKINPGQLNDINNTIFGCPAQDIAFNCIGGHAENPPFSEELKPVSNTNWTPRMSTGLEFQVMLPVINAPFRVYWAYNPMRLDTTSTSPVAITRDMFPAGAAGDYTYDLALSSFSPKFRLREPRKTFRFTVNTTF